MHSIYQIMIFKQYASIFILSHVTSRLSEVHIISATFFETRYSYRLSIITQNYKSMKKMNILSELSLFFFFCNNKNQVFLDRVVNGYRHMHRHRSHGIIARTQQAPWPFIHHVLLQQALPSQVSSFHYILSVSCSYRNIIIICGEKKYTIIDDLKQKRY